MSHAIGSTHDASASKPVTHQAAVLAEVWRGDLVESAHLGHAVVLGPDGSNRHSAGDQSALIYARSSLKPLQAYALLRAGWNPASDESVALASGSHSGEPPHLKCVEAMLTEAGLTTADLQNTPGFPINFEIAGRLQAEGAAPQHLWQNCSGKHAAMLATCVANGWDTATYLDPGHPVQQAIAREISALTGDDATAHVTVDGCGTPLFATTLSGLARAFTRLRTGDGPAARRVARAMETHPELVGGNLSSTLKRDVTAAMQAVPGLICKDGAEGVYAGTLPDGTAFAFKVLDGSWRPRPAILAATLRAAGALNVPGVDEAVLTALSDVEVLGGGQPVGRVEVRI